MSETQTSDISETEGAAAETPQPEWALVEIMGHRRHAGLCEEVQCFGTTMLRIDIYRTGDVAPVQTLFYGGSRTARSRRGRRRCGRSATTVTTMTTIEWRELPG